MQINIVDAIILLSLLFAAVDGWRRGIIAILLDLLALVVALSAAALLYQSVGNLFGQFGLGAGLQPMVGFIVTLIVVDIALRGLIGWIGSLVSKIIRLGGFGSLLGATVGVLKQTVLLGLFINLLLFLPVIPQVRTEIQSSRVAPRFALQSPVIEKLLHSIIEPAVKELQAVTTVVKISDSPVSIDTPIQSLVVDEQAEQELWQLVNKERKERGLVELEWSDELAVVGRAHSKDMWERQYFAHVNPDKKTPFDRLDAAAIEYRDAGENLALAPTTPIAHQGLMDSPGHRANILKPEYRKLGIGSVRNGLYGVMYTQLFTN